MREKAPPHHTTIVLMWRCLLSPPQFLCISVPSLSVPILPSELQIKEIYDLIFWGGFNISDPISFSLTCMVTFGLLLLAQGHIDNAQIKIQSSHLYKN